MAKPLRIVHYLNQFFGQIGGEEKADAAPRLHEGPVGPGMLLQERLGERGRVVATVICGDNYAAERQETAGEVLALLQPLEFGAFVAGPAFNAGRYGLACGSLCAAVREARGVPCVTAMFAENPAVAQFRSRAYIVRCGSTAREMPRAIEAVTALTLKVAAAPGEAGVGKGGLAVSPEVDGYFPQGRTVNVVGDRLAAARAVEMLLARVAGRPFHSEIPLPTPGRVPPAPALREPRGACLALVTEGGLVPAGNPDGLVGARASSYRAYSIAGLGSLKAGAYESVHRGFDTTAVNADPNRIVPLDAARQLEAEGVFGKLHETYYVTSGCATWIESSQAMAAGIAEELRRAGVDGVILTAT